MTGATSPARDGAATNVRGGASGASWRFLLPSLDLSATVIVGSPSALDRRAIAAVGGEPAILEPRSFSGRRRARRAGVPPKRGTRPDPAPASMHSVVVLGRSGASALRKRRIRAELSRIVSPDAVSLVLRTEQRGSERSTTPLPGAVRERLRVGTTDGDVRWAAPRADAAATELGRSLGERVGGGVRGRALRLLAVPRRLVVRGTVAADVVSTVPVSGPPRYLCDLAAASGLDVTRRRWAMAIPGLYASNKAVFFFLPEGSDGPDIVVKLARAPSQNLRLENESAALRELVGTRWFRPGSAPRELFFGIHEGARVLGETALTGSPFRQRTTARSDCPHARAVVERLLDLGVGTAAPQDPASLRSSVAELLERYRRLYRPEPRHDAFLAEQVDLLASVTVPSVFQHGDPGTWNILIGRDAEVGFLDWEAADPHGVPLWDIFYFLRSFAVTVSRADGTDDALAAIRRSYVQSSPLADLLVDTVGRARAALALPAASIEPLFHTCWMHRAVKQAARLSGRRLRRGHYHRLVSMTIEERAAPALRALFAGG